MHKIITLIVLSFSMFLFFGCSKDDDETSWSTRVLWPEGGNPVPSPDGSKIMFSVEGENGGLYLWQSGSATHLNPDGPEAREDYAWSHDGTRICFSSPSGSGSGIYVSGQNDFTFFTRIWDRGASPQFLATDSSIVCAGPEDASENQGLWEINVTSLERTRFDAVPVAKVAVSPDGHKSAYFVTTGSSFGRLLLTYNHVTHFYDTAGTNAIDMAWFSNSESFVYESVLEGFQQFYRVSHGDTLPGVNILNSVTHPRAYPSGNAFVYSVIIGDELNGVFSYDGGEVSHIMDNCWTAVPVSHDRIIAVSSDGIVELRR